MEDVLVYLTIVSFGYYGGYWVWVQKLSN